MAEKAKYEKIWTAIRGMNGFTAAEVAAVSDVNIDYVAKFLSQLKSSGYITRKGTYYEGRGNASYLLVKNTGPLAPSLRTCFWDPNLREYVGKEKTDGRMD